LQVLNYVLYVACNVVSVPLTVFAMDGAGRRWTLAAAQFGIAAATIAMAFSPKSAGGLMLGLYLLGENVTRTTAQLVFNKVSRFRKLGMDI
jgi:MFS family permease